jgi:hypothetical protein
MKQTFIDILPTKSRMKKNINRKKMTYIEIYKILFFEKKNIDYKKIIISTKNNLIIVTISAKQYGAQKV